MRASQNDRINLRIFQHHLIDTLLNKVIGSRAVGLISLYNGSPQWTGNTRYLDIRMNMGTAFYGKFQTLFVI